MGVALFFRRSIQATHTSSGKSADLRPRYRQFETTLQSFPCAAVFEAQAHIFVHHHVDFRIGCDARRDSAYFGDFGDDRV
jgi:hypothetical protein